MGKIKKILENELVGGTQNTDVYPVTSIKAVYDENNERLDHILARKGVVNISTNYNDDHIAEVLTLPQALNKVPSSDRTLGFLGTFLTDEGWILYQFGGDSTANWTDLSLWSAIATVKQLDENLIYKRELASKTITGVGTGTGQIAFGWFSAIQFKKGDRGVIAFTSSGDVNSVSAYMTKNPNDTAGGYQTIVEANRNLDKGNPLQFPFTAYEDCYIMFNTSAETSVSVTATLYSEYSVVIENEINRAKGAENNLQGQVDTLTENVSSNTDDISALIRKSQANSNAVSRPTPIVGKVTSWGPDTFGRVEDNDLYALALLPIQEGATSLTVSGVEVYNTLLYTDIPSDSNYAEVVVPSWTGGTNNTIDISAHPEARYIALNFQVASNPSGYDDLSVLFNTDIKVTSTRYKLFQFGGIQNKQADLGGNNQTNWASVVHGVAAQEIDTLYVKKIRGTIANSLTFRLYKGTGITVNTAFTELVDTIIITADEFNNTSNGDIIKLPLTNKIDISIKDYYTLEVDLVEADAIYGNRFGAYDAAASHNFIREGFYKTNHGNWAVVSTYPEGKYTYGLLWGVYLGEDVSVNFDRAWQEKFHMNILSSLSESVDSLSESVDSQFIKLPLGVYDLTGNNPEGEPSGAGRSFNFTSLELEKGVQYTFDIEYMNEDEIGSLSFYTTNVQGTNNYGYVEIVILSESRPAGLATKVTFIPSVNGYLMFNMGATTNGSVKVTVSKSENLSNVHTSTVETGTLTGNNEDTAYGNINFKHFSKKLYAGRRYQIRLVQNLISNVPNTEFRSLSCYVEYTQGSIGGGYEAVFESKSSFENNETIEYTPTKDGYLMLNTYATVNKTFYITIYTQDVLENRVEDLENRVEDLENKDDDTLSIKQKAKTVTSNNVGIFPIIKPQFKDVYLTLCGDSIFAFQSTFTKDEKGVAAVPPTCDKKANANMLWNALGWGNPQYRRFDYGKKSLVGDWDNTWSDDSNALFTETGTFKTEYIGQTRREDPNFAGRIGTNVMQVSTKIDEASFPYQFDNSEDSWWQRNIPKRFSNSANASVKFTIPAGYSKFDFLYHAHIHGDNVTITVDRGNGVVKVNTVPNDFNGSGTKEANNSVFDLSMANLTELGGGNDTYGIPNMRLYFNITDTSQATTITITKTSDTSKYLIYWGITYWGTPELPYALHINNMAIGGYGQGNIYNLRSAMFKFVYSDAIILEMCYNNLANKSFSSQITSMNTNMDNLKTYFENLGKDISTDIGVWIPHCGQQGYRDYPDTVKCNYAGAEKLAIDKGYKVILNLDKICNDVHDTYYSDISMSDFMNSLGNNGAHLDMQGQWIYSAAWESMR